MPTLSNMIFENKLELAVWIKECGPIAPRTIAKAHELADQLVVFKELADCC